MLHMHTLYDSHWVALTDRALLLQTLLNLPHLCLLCQLCPLRVSDRTSKDDFRSGGRLPLFRTSPASAGLPVLTVLVRCLAGESWAA